MTQDMQTTISHLGGNRFVAMTGATFSREGDVLTVKLPRLRAVNISLNGSDLYDVELITMNPKTYAVKRQKVENVYCDQLCETFTSLTGLATSL